MRSSVNVLVASRVFSPTTNLYTLVIITTLLWSRGKFVDITAVFALFVSVTDRLDVFATTMNIPRQKIFCEADDKKNMVKGTAPDPAAFSFCEISVVF